MLGVPPPPLPPSRQAAGQKINKKKSRQKAVIGVFEPFPNYHPTKFAKCWVCGSVVPNLRRSMHLLGRLDCMQYGQYKGVSAKYATEQNQYNIYASA